MKRVYIATAVLTLMIVSLTGCGGAGSVTSNDFSAKRGVLATDGGMLYSSDYTGTSSNYESTSYESEADIVKNSMMIVRDANLSVDVGNLEEYDEKLKEAVLSFGGYFEQAEVNGYDSDWSSSRYAYYRIRIPAESLDAFLEVTNENGKVTSRSVSSEDVSLDYVDVEAHLSTLEKEVERLEELLSQATELSDILEIEDRIYNVQAQLDSYKGQKRLLEGRVSYSTVYLNAREERNVDHPVRQAFSVNFREELVDGLESAVNALVKIVVSIPLIAVLTAFATLFLWIGRKIWKRIFKKDTSKKQVKTKLTKTKPGVADPIHSDLANKPTENNEIKQP